MIKKYTLYFKGKNKYGHEHSLPIIKLELRRMDEYTSNYEDYCDLFECLPYEVKEFIKQNISDGINLTKNNDLKKCFVISNDNLKTNIEFILYDDIDVLYINKSELNELLIDNLMSFNEFQDSLLKSSTNKENKRKYELYKRLYDNFIKDRKMLSMIDTYDISKKIPNLKGDKLYIGALATDKTNMLVLSKKLEEDEINKRSITFMFKHLCDDKKIISYMKLETRKNKGVDISVMKSEILSNLNKFIKKYNKEYDS